MYRYFTKPLFDWITALIILMLALPLFLICMLLLFIVNRGKIWFVQPRPGKNGIVFRIVKFKTMTDIRDNQGNLLPDKDRLTGVGNLIRKLSLDELPQLLNVLKGDMSIVGPRPLLVEYLPLYNEIQRRRHEVKPGITGWAQVNGRNAISWTAKFNYDVWYVSNLSFAVDIKILLLTVLKVLKGSGISAEGQATIEKFTGNHEKNSNTR